MWNLKSGINSFWRIDFVSDSTKVFVCFNITSEKRAEIVYYYGMYQDSIKTGLRVEYQKKIRTLFDYYETKQNSSGQVDFNH